jgi:hypothetical protein
LDIPYFLYFAAINIIKLEGEHTEGVFRVSGSTAKVEEIRQAVNRNDYTNFSFSYNSLHTLTSAFKLFFRQLPEAIIPNEVYEKCFADPPLEFNALACTLPAPNHRVLLFLVEFLRRFIKPEVIERTKMTANNLAAVFAPCLFRCPYTDTTAFIQASEKEKRFLMKMIDSLDTANTTKITTVCIPEEEPSSLSSPPRSAPPLPQRIPSVSYRPMPLASCPDSSRSSEVEKTFPSPSTPRYL